jgi:hypothetical protein
VCGNEQKNRIGLRMGEIAAREELVCRLCPCSIPIYFEYLYDIRKISKVKINLKCYCSLVSARYSGYYITTNAQIPIIRKKAEDTHLFETESDICE